MKDYRQRGLTFSAIFHFLFLLLAIFGLPSIFHRRPPEEPIAITVELLPITGVTNVKPSEAQPAPEEKPNEKKQEEPKKPTPPVKTAEETPPPPPPPEVVKPKDKKEPEKKPEDKKTEKKKKPKEDNLEAVLKAVRDTAKKDKDSDKNKESSKNKSHSTQYDPTMQMSLSEKDAIRSQFAKCWNVPAGAKDAHELVVLLDLELAQDGSLIKVELADESRARYNSDSFFRAAADSAMRAVHLCSPLKNLPPDKYETWREMELTFDPKEMLF